nr:MAG TPA: hypothetical protein [Bacteriophage sp.]
MNFRLSLVNSHKRELILFTRIPWVYQISLFPNF